MRRERDGRTPRKCLPAARREGLREEAVNGATGAISASPSSIPRSAAGSSRLADGSDLTARPNGWFCLVESGRAFFLSGCPFFQRLEKSGRISGLILDRYFQTGNADSARLVLARCYR